MNRTTWIFPLLLCSLVVPTMAAETETVTSQTRVQYEASLHHSDYLLQITVVDDRTGNSWTGCTLTGLLFGALKEESGQRNTWDIDAHERAMAAAVADSSRVFHFSNPMALVNMTTVTDPAALSGKVNRACIEMKKTGCMRQQDLTGRFVPC
jgi:hypothetical protein